MPLFISQEQECSERFQKDCTITYKSVPKIETVETCVETYSRDCNKTGPRVCSTEHETGKMNNLGNKGFVMYIFGVCHFILILLTFINSCL
jgi:uncharacterized protein YgiB involved in biofilm formation